MSEVIEAMCKVADGCNHPLLYDHEARRVLRAALEAAGCRGFKTLDMGFGETALAFDCDDRVKDVLEKLTRAAYPDSVETSE